MSDRGRGGYGGRGDRGGRGGRGGGGDFGGRGGPGGGGGHYGGDRGNRGGGFDQRGRGPSRPRGGPIRIFREGNIPRPDPEVAKVESAIVQDITRPLAALSVDDQIKLPLRPGYGTAGQNIILWTNYFQLNSLAKNAILFRYAVSFQGETAEDKIPKPKKKRLIQLLLQQPPFSSARIASDWAQSLVSMKKLDLGADKAAFDIEWYPEDGEPPKADDDETRRKKNTFKLLVIPLLSVSLNKLLDDIKSSKIRYPQRLETIQALNIVLGSGPSSDPKIAVSGTNKFYPFNPHRQYDPFSLGGGLMAYRGYYTSVRTGANRMLVNVNVATGAFYRDGPLLDIMNEIIGDQKQSKQHYDKMTVFVRKLRFETTYLRQTDKSGKKVPKRKVHTITDLSPFGKNSTNVTFTVDGKTLTVQEHFSKAHGIRLRFPPAPLVNYGERNNPKWIPAELCTVLGGQLARRLLQGEQTRAMISFAARPPFDNATNIVKDGLQVAKLSANDHLKGFNLHVNPELLTVNGRILPPPVLQYRQKTWTAENGAWNLDTRQLGRNPFKVAKRLGKWACVLINLGNQEAIRGGPRAAKPQLETFRSTLESYGLAPPPLENKDIVPVTINFHNLNNRNLDDIQKTIISGLRNGLSGKPSFVLFLLPNDNAVVYDCIKHVCDVQLGLPNVCSIATKFTKERGQLQYFANLALKFNQKLGGVNHSIGANSLKPLDAQTIVFGIDVTHPSPGSSEKSPSIAGVVASIDAEFSQYPASMRTQEGRKEMVTDLKEMVTERLKTWSQYNKGALPSKVFVYRDGVSEGQYSIVMKDEYPHFVTAFNEMYGDVSKHPKVSIIVVGKRHHTRFYPTRKEDADPKNGNPKPGTVVDRGVTDETLFDFFLLAHQGLQGTSKPAHYVVLKDDNRLGADQLQVLTHNLCYTFARATRAVSICPPAYYADLLCERGRCFLHAVLKGGDSADNFDTTRHWTRDVHSQVAHTMYYL